MEEFVFFSCLSLLLYQTISLTFVTIGTIAMYALYILLNISKYI